VASKYIYLGPEILTAKRKAWGRSFAKWLQAGREKQELLGTPNPQRGRSLGVIFQAFFVVE